MAAISPTTKPEDNVAYPVDAYITQVKRLDLLATLMGGTVAMKAAGVKYLPKEPEESEKAYENRLERSYLLNAFRRTIMYLGGQVFSRPMILQDDNPQVIKDLTEDIDLQGNNIDVFAKKVFEQGLIDGSTFILVDYPQAPTNLTKEQEKNLGLRPYWVHIPIANLIGWKIETRNGKSKLIQIRIKEEVEKPKGKYGTQMVASIRVINLGSYEVYEDTSGGKENSWELIDSGLTTFKDEIPLALFKPGEKITFMTSAPPLEDLAYLNLAHWQSNSDQSNILHFARVPLLFGKMLADDPTKVVIGPNRMIHSSREESDLKYVEHTGAAIGVGREQLDDIENRMALYGLQLLLPKTGRITATEKALSSSESDCTLKTWALMFKDTLEQALVYTNKWMKSEESGSVTVNTEFRLLQTADADVLIKAKVANILPRMTVLQEFLRRGIIAEDSDLEQIESWLLEEESNDVRLLTTGTFLKNMQSTTTLPKPEGVLPEPKVPIGKNPRAKLPNFTKKGK